MFCKKKKKKSVLYSKADPRRLAPRRAVQKNSETARIKKKKNKVEGKQKVKIQSNSQGRSRIIICRAREQTKNGIEETQREFGGRKRATAVRFSFVTGLNKVIGAILHEMVLTANMQQDVIGSARRSWLRKGAECPRQRASKQWTLAGFSQRVYQ